MNRIITVFFLSCSIWILGADHALNIPYIANVNDWETVLIIDNAGHDDISLTVTTFTAGAIDDSTIFTVSAGESRHVALIQGTCGIVEYDGSNVAVKVSYLHSVEKGIAEFILDENTDTQLNYTLPQYLSDTLDWMGVAAMNPTSSDAWSTFEAFDQYGFSLAVTDTLIGAHDRVVTMVSELFPGVDDDNVARIRVTSDESICGITISGRGSSQLLFTPAIAGNPGSVTLYLPHVAAAFPDLWENNLVFDNLGEETAAVILLLYHDGEVVVEEEIIVPGHGNLVVDLNNYAEHQVDSGMISDCPLSLAARLNYVFKATGGTAEFYLNNNTVSDELVFNFPEYAGDKLSWHGFALFNTTSEKRRILLKAYRDGEEIERKLITLRPKTNFVRTLDSVFTRSFKAGIHRVLVNGDGETVGINMSGEAEERFLNTQAVDYQETRNFLERLHALPDVQVLNTSTLVPFSLSFRILVTQPLDHANPAGETFVQEIYLNHFDESLPMVMVTGGYYISRNYVTELSDILHANEIIIPHRFFVDAEPDVMDWEHLTIEQAAADHHHIVTLLMDLYKGKWVNTGGSKSGMTAMFHRRFHPDDVDVTVAYVAPIMLAFEDPRTDHFLLEEVGTADCRWKIWQFQRTVLENRDMMILFLQSYAAQYGLTFNRLGYDAALEHAVLEYPFAFWQYAPSDCDSIPGEFAPAYDIFIHLRDQVGFYIYSDYFITLFEPAFYQFFTEFGYCGYLYEHLEHMLVALDNPTYTDFAPLNVPMTYDPEVMLDILNWLQTEGDYIIYIYGGQDPWTACAVELTGQTIALKVMEPGADHRIRINDLTQRDLVLSTLEEWLGLDISYTNMKRLYDEPMEDMRQFKFIDFYRRYE